MTDPDPDPELDEGLPGRLLPVGEVALVLNARWDGSRETVPPDARFPTLGARLGHTDSLRWAAIRQARHQIRGYEVELTGLEPVTPCLQGSTASVRGMPVNRDIGRSVAFRPG